MNKRVSTGLKSFFILIIAFIAIFIFGFGSITKFLFKKVLFTPYNIVGIIMTVATISGGYINKRQGHWLKLTLTIIFGIISIASITCNVLSWFNIDLINLVWNNILKSTFISIGKVLLWILLSVIALLTIGFLIYVLIKLICYIKEERDFKEMQNSYQNVIVKYKPSDKIHDIINYNTKHISDICKQQTINSSKINLLQNHNVVPELKKQIGSNKVSNAINKQQEVETIKSEENSKSKISIPSEKNKDSNVCIYPDNYEKKIAKNICPICGWRLIKRKNSITGEQFRGCTNYGYHNCTFTISDNEYIKIYKEYNSFN